MKYKTTTKAIRSCYENNNILSIGYCDAWHLLHFRDANAYTSGVYGWNFDVYNVDGVAICTGYRGMPGRNPKNLKKYEEKARSIIADYSKTYEQQKKAVEKLLLQFIKQA